MDPKDIQFSDVLAWLIQNVDDNVAMDKINKLTFPFTTRYSARFGAEQNKQAE